MCKEKILLIDANFTLMISIEIRFYSMLIMSVQEIHIEYKGISNSKLSIT